MIELFAKIVQPLTILAKKNFLILSHEVNIFSCLTGLRLTLRVKSISKNLQVKTQQTLTCLKLTIGTVEKCVKSVMSF